MIFALVFSIVVASATGRTYERCELARELRYVHDVPEHEIPTWVCIAEHESQYNTSAVGSLNGDGSNDHGLFQISDLFWCSNSGSGKACNIACSDLEDDDIEDDLDCIRRIHKEHKTLSGDGFNAWAVYKPHCKGSKADKYVEECFTATDAPLVSGKSPKKKTTTKKVYPWLVPRAPTSASSSSPSPPPKSHAACFNQVQLPKKFSSPSDDFSKVRQFTTASIFSTTETPLFSLFPRFGSVSPDLSTTTTLRDFPVSSRVSPTVSGIANPSTTTTYRGFPRFHTVSPALSTLHKEITPSQGFISSTVVPVQTVYTFPTSQNRFYSTSTSSRPSHQLRGSIFADAPAAPIARQISPNTNRRATFIINGAAWI